MYDEACLGDVNGWKELLDYLEDYDKNWCIARETEDVWTDAILANTPHLFSIGHDDQMVSLGPGASRPSLAKFRCLLLLYFRITTQLMC